MTEWTVENTRHLINLVQANRPLYAKGEKLFKNTMAKELMWQSIGANLNPPCSGEAASKKFKSLRDAFVREHRQATAVQNLPSGSAGGNMPQHIPSEFYSDLLFLKEHIGAPRTNTATNVKRLKMETEASTFIVGDSGSLTPISSPIPFHQTQSVTLENVQDALSNVHGPPTPSTSSVTSIVSSLSVPSCETTDTESQCSQDGSDPIMMPPSLTPKSSSVRNRAAASLLKSPAPDMRQKKGNLAADSLVKNITEMSQAVATLIKTKTQEKKEEPTPNHTDPAVSSFQTLLTCALEKVPEQRKFMCMSELLSMADAYANDLKRTFQVPRDG